MATIRNPTQFGLFSSALGRSLAAGEVVDGLSDEIADEACRPGVLERGVLVTVEPEPTADTADEDEQPKRGRGRPRSIRGAVEVEEVVDAERETRG